MWLVIVVVVVVVVVVQVEVVVRKVLDDCGTVCVTEDVDDCSHTVTGKGNKIIHGIIYDDIWSS